MIGICRETGRTLTGLDQLASRITQVMTTQLAGREKRRQFGSRVRETLHSNMTDSTLVLAQSYALEAFYNPENGIADFAPARCVARRRSDGLSLWFEGQWQGRTIQLEVNV